MDLTALTTLVYPDCPRLGLWIAGTEMIDGICLHRRPSGPWVSCLSSLISDWSLECLDPDVRLDLSRLSSPCSLGRLDDDLWGRSSLSSSRSLESLRCRPLSLLPAYMELIGSGRNWVVTPLIGVAVALVRGVVLGIQCRGGAGV